MFTGIIQCLGEIVRVAEDKAYIILNIKIAHKDIALGDSIACDGVCLTVNKILSNNIYEFIVSKATLNCTNIVNWQHGYFCNIEPAIVAGAKFDGHFVTGHVDATGVVTKIQDTHGGVEFLVDCCAKNPSWCDKGSIALNGVSLTINKVYENTVSCMIVPYTWQHTNLQFMQEGDIINIEFDMMYKMIESCFNRYTKRQQ